MAIDIKPWLDRAERVRTDDIYDHANFARDLAGQLTWAGALDFATALRSYVYGQPGGSELHKAIEPLYRRLGWQQSALIACWFRDANNRPTKRHWPPAAGGPDQTGPHAPARAG